MPLSPQAAPPARRSDRGGPPGIAGGGLSQRAGGGPPLGIPRGLPMGGPGAAGGGPGGMFGGDTTTISAAVRYAKAHGGGTIGVSSQSSAAAAILANGANVAGLGGFSGRESSVSAAWIAGEVRSGHQLKLGRVRRPSPGRQVQQGICLLAAAQCLVPRRRSELLGNLGWPGRVQRDLQRA